MATDWKLKSEHSPLLMKEDETSFNDSINSKFYQYKQDVYIQEEFINFYGTQLQTRMIIIRLSNADLFIVSPGRITPSITEKLQEIGSVKYVVSPNKIHNLGMRGFKIAYSDCKLFASPGLEERCPDIKFHATLTDNAEPQWNDEIRQLTIKGNSFFSEVFFLHKPSKTLIVGDFIENIQEQHIRGIQSYILGCCFVTCCSPCCGGAFDRAAPSPEHVIYTTDTEALRNSIEEVLSWDFEQIVISHGTFIESSPKAVLQEIADEIVERAIHRWSCTKKIFRCFLPCI